MINYHNKIIKNFLSEIVSGEFISTQFGAFSTDNKENIITTNSFCDQTRRSFFDLAAKLLVSHDSIFGYLATNVFIGDTELLVISSIEKKKGFKESAFKIERDNKMRVTKTSEYKTKIVLLPEVEALLEGLK